MGGWQTLTSSPYRAGESGWLVRQEYTKSEVSGFEKGIFRTASEVTPSGKDTIGRKLSFELQEKLKKTVLKDENGNTLSLYRWTFADFVTFAKGNMGFRFGSLEAAHDRYLQPVCVKIDLLQW